MLSLSRQRSSKQKQCEMKCYSGYQITNNCLRLSFKTRQAAIDCMGEGAEGFKPFSSSIDWLNRLYFSPPTVHVFWSFLFIKKAWIIQSRGIKNKKKVHMNLPHVKIAWKFIYTLKFTTFYIFNEISRRKKEKRTLNIIVICHDSTPVVCYRVWKTLTGF